MEVILQQDFPALGYVGDRVKVRGGYARNYLIPRGIAVEGSSRNEKLLRHRLGGINARKRRMRSDAEELKGKVEQIKLEFFLRMGGSGKSFGSITSRDIEAALKKEGFNLDRRQVILHEPIRKGGEHQVGIKLHSEVTGNISVRVNTELPEAKPVEKKEEAAPAAEGEVKPKKRGRTKKAAKEGAPEGEAQETTESPNTETKSEQ